jgi:hypothetical protein
VLLFVIIEFQQRKELVQKYYRFKVQTCLIVLAV